VEDLGALIDEAGGAAFVYGKSSGAVLALEAARKLPTKIKKLALYEPPFIVDDSRPLPPKNYATQLNELTAAGRRGDAVEFFLTEVVGMPAEAVAPMRLRQGVHARDGRRAEPFMDAPRGASACECPSQRAAPHPGRPDARRGLGNPCCAVGGIFRRLKRPCSGNRNGIATRTTYTPPRSPGCGRSPRR
jgi:pimeloyl-ACP methyl ester carboxylesterase